MKKVQKVPLNSVIYTDPVNTLKQDDAEGSQEKIGLLGHGTTGLSVFMTAVFLVGEMAGSGVLALPKAVESTGWIGLVLLCFCAFICDYTGEVISDCWRIVQDRFPSMRGPVRYPYPAIGMLTFGRWGRLVVSLSIDFTMMGGSVVFLLLAAQNMHSVVQANTSLQIAFCYWLIIMLAVLCPLTMPGSPKDFKYIGVMATAATSTACAILLVLMGLDSRRERTVIHSKVEPMSFATAFGTMLFALGGHPIFPTLQIDMKKPQKFKLSCRAAYLILVLMYFPVAAGGYFVYGEDVADNVLQTVVPSVALQVVQCLITAHLICSFVICINPVCQEMEEILGVDRRFNYKRVVVRTMVCLFVLAVAETVPHFGAVLSLIGGSSVTLTAFVCPPVFYFKLALSQGPWKTVQVSLGKAALLIEIMLVGILAGAASTYSAIRVLASPNAFTVPCFINVTAVSG